MRLINVETLALELWLDHRTRPPYAILSHTWGDDEVLAHELTVLDPETVHKKGFTKIRFTCQQARKDGLQYAWVDTCCIDKTSSSELSEAINSMFAWYSEAKVCYVYLEDVEIGPCKSFGLSCASGNCGEAGQSSCKWFTSQFASSRWFTRGWTLQELVAPRHIEFYSRTWNSLGSLPVLATLVADITKIPLIMLHHDIEIYAFSIAKRMSWASRRKTTRKEDEAYCLLGIFGINMPLIYGEREKAFMRLQEEIIRNSADTTLLAWDYTPELRDEGFKNLAGGSLLAPSPAAFSRSGFIRRFDRFVPPLLNMTNRGLRLTLPTVHASIHGVDRMLISVNAFDQRFPSYAIALAVAFDNTGWEILRDGETIPKPCYIGSDARLSLVSRNTNMKLEHFIINRVGYKMNVAERPGFRKYCCYLRVMQLQSPARFSVTLKDLFPSPAWNPDPVFCILPFPFPHAPRVTFGFVLFVQGVDLHGDGSKDVGNGSTIRVDLTLTELIQAGTTRLRGYLECTALEVVTHKGDLVQKHRFASGGQKCDACSRKTADSTASRGSSVTCALVHLHSTSQNLSRQQFVINGLDRQTQLKFEILRTDICESTIAVIVEDSQVFATDMIWHFFQTCEELFWAFVSLIALVFKRLWYAVFSSENQLSPRDDGGAFLEHEKTWKVHQVGSLVRVEGKAARRNLARDYRFRVLSDIRDGSRRVLGTPKESELT